MALDDVCIQTSAAALATPYMALDDVCSQTSAATLATLSTYARTA
jgi:hypothetical protein